MATNPQADATVIDGLVKGAGAPEKGEWPQHGGPRQYGDPTSNFKNRMARGQHSKALASPRAPSGDNLHPAIKR